MRSAQPTVLVVGGSLGGLAAGAVLARQGWRVRILERASSGLESRGTGIATHPELFRAFERMGITRLDDLGVQLDGRIAMKRDGSILCRYDHPQVLSFWGTLYRRLLAAVPAECYRTGAEVVAVEDCNDGVTLRLADGSREDGDLLIGADGVWSQVRTSLSPRETPSYCGYIGWRGVLDEALLPATFRGRFGAVTTFYVQPGEQFAMYPMAGVDDSLVPGRRRFGFLWYMAVDEATELPDLLTDIDGHRNNRFVSPLKIQLRHVQCMRERAMRTLPPELAQVVQLTAQPFIQPIFDLAATRIAFRRSALVGDAAFVVRPHVGAGVLKAASDAVALGEALAEEPTIDAALRRYEAERIPPGQRMVDKGRRLGAYLQSTGGALMPAMSAAEVIREAGRG